MKACEKESKLTYSYDLNDKVTKKIEDVVKNVYGGDGVEFTEEALKKIEDMKLDKIAELISSGLKQSQVGERLGLSQQIISYRMGIIRTQYPELLAGAPAQVFTKNTKKPTKIQKTEPEILQTNVDDTKDFTNDTNDTKTTKNTKICEEETVCRPGEPRKKFSREENEKNGFNF